MSTYDKDILSAEDRAELTQAQEDWKVAKKAGDKAGMDAAHNRAEAIRAAYGYSGGSDGAGYSVIPGYEGAEQIKETSEQVKETAEQVKTAAADYDAAYDAIDDVYKTQAEASKNDIAKQRETAMREAYIGNMMDQKNLDQKLRASGTTGGLAETSRVSLQNNYRNNRNAVETAAINAGKEVDLELSKNLAQNKLSRADTKYNAAINTANFQNTAANFQNTAANFQNTAANNNRNIVANEENTKLSKYLTFLDNGFVDENNIGKVSQALGVSEDTVRKANTQRQNGQYDDMALTLLSNGIYDDSFTNYFGGRFSAETLKAFAAQNVPVKTSSGGSVVYTGGEGEGQGGEGKYQNYSPEDVVDAMPGIGTRNPNSPISSYTYQDILESIKTIDYGNGFTEEDWAAFGELFGMTAEQAQKFVKAFKRSQLQPPTATVEEYTRKMKELNK